MPGKSIITCKIKWTIIYKILKKKLKPKTTPVIYEKLAVWVPGTMAH